MHLFQEKGNNDFANKTIEAIAAYHEIVQRKKRNNYDQDYNAAFDTIDSAIRNIANKVFYIYGSDSFNHAYDIQAVRGRLHKDFLK